MGFFSFLSFLAPKDTSAVIETATKGIYNGIDKIVFTEEEKSEANQKALDTVLNFHKLYVTENTVQSYTRRYLALLLIGFFLFAATAWILSNAFYPILSPTIGLLLDKLDFAFNAVVVTYFVPYQLSKIVGKK